MKKVIIFMFIFCYAPYLYSKTIMVPEDSLTIQGGINGATNGDTVLVNQGTFYEQDISIKQKEIVVISRFGHELTSIDCINFGRGFYIKDVKASTSKLSGFTIQNGYKNIEEGGGIFCENSNITLDELKIFKNKAFLGGGIYLIDSSPLIKNCIILENISEGGGGVQINNASPIMYNCIISKNKASAGAGIAGHDTFLQIIKCSICGNHAFTGGGGIFCNESSLMIDKSIIKTNKAGFDGGISITNSDFSTITNCLIYENSAFDSGGGLICHFSYVNIFNCSFYGNIVNNDKLGGGLNLLDSFAKILNCIFWNDEPYEISGCDLGVCYSDVQGGWQGQGNINIDPRFIDPENGNFHLFRESPCIDAGDPDYPVPFGGGLCIDMGAYEYYKGFNCNDIKIPVEYDNDTLQNNFRNWFERGK